MIGTDVFAPGADADEVRQRLREREEMLSTRLGSAIAIPHAQFPQIGETIVIVGDQADHFDTLSSVAVKLKSSS